MLPAFSMRLFWAALACLVMLFGAHPGAAQSGLAGDPIQVCTLRDRGGEAPAALLRSPERFDCDTPQHRLGPGNYWVLSQPLDRKSLPGAALRLRFASLWQAGLGLHILYADGHVASFQTDARGVAPLIQLGAIVEQPVPVYPQPVLRVLWHVQGAANTRGILVGPHVATEAQSVHANLAMAGLYAGFAGLALALIVYNLALWASLRHSFQLYYCAMMAGLFGYTVSSSGVFAWLFPMLSNNDRLRFNYLLLGFAGAAGLVFVRSFFEARIFSGWLGRAIALLAGTLLAIGILFFFVGSDAGQVLDRLFSLTFLGVIAVVGPLAWRAWRMRSDYLWLFAIGWGAPMLTVVLRTFANFHWLPWSFWLDNSTLLAMAFEATMSAIAIAYRIRILRGQRDEARAGEVTARHLADIDPLTGLLNRRAFLHQAVGREGEQVLLLADIDHFKRVNETLGHDGGDEVLRLFARLLRTSIPAGALAARIGGEEFAILTSADMPIEPEALLSRLRMLRQPFDIRVTASIGVAHGRLDREADWKAIYRQADAALYAAKAAGRDRARRAA